MDPQPAGPYFSKVIEKGLRILKLFTPETPSLSLKEITRETRINPTSVFRFVETLIQLGYLKKDPKTKLIRLGTTALTLSNQVIRSFDILQIVKPHIDRLFEKLNVTVDSAVVEDSRLVLLYRRDAQDTLAFRLPVSSPSMHCSALGKAYLSALPEAALRRVLDGLTFARRTPHSLTTRAAVLAELRRTRERGYSLNNEEFILGLISVGAPLVNLDGVVIGAASCDVSTMQYSLEEAERRFAPAVLELAKDIQPELPL
jgi:IclR family pca regulon transcriptional regulator